jgi:hypothetical protein
MFPSNFFYAVSKQLHLLTPDHDTVLFEPCFEKKAISTPPAFGQDVGHHFVEKQVVPYRTVVRLPQPSAGDCVKAVTRQTFPLARHEPIQKVRLKTVALPCHTRGAAVEQDMSSSKAPFILPA